MNLSLLGVRIDSKTKRQALEKLASFLDSNEQHMVFTPNPEMLVAAVDNEYYRDVLNRASLNICDGFGVQIFAKGRVERIPGIDFVYDICELAEHENKKVYIVGSKDQETIGKAAEELKKKFPKLNLAGFKKGPKIEIDYWNNKTALEYAQTENDDLVGEIIETAPDILLVGFGVIKQEQWIDENLPNMPSVKVAMGVGGSFDVIGGRLKRAPKFMRSLGFEWLWRLFLEPSRTKRIWTAVVIFPYRCLFKPKSKFD